jgi:uncharacterized membrane protein (Fun14 family)
MYSKARDVKDEDAYRFMNVVNFSSVLTTVGVGFFAGLLIGFAIKKIIKIAAVIIGLFFAGLAYLQYQQIVNINWNKLQAASQNAVTTLADASTQIPGFSSSDHTAALSNLGIPLTGSMSMGFAVGFIKG